MWSVSNDFLDSIANSGDIKTVVTVTVGGETVELAMVSGSVSASSGSNVRRQASLVVSGGDDKDLNDKITQDGAVLKIRHGFDWGFSEELVPVFTGFLSQSVRRRGDGVITLSAADFGANVNAQRLAPSVTQAASMSRADAIAALVTDAFPGITVHDDGSDLGTLDSEQTWSGSRWDAINALASDGLTEAFFYPDGSFCRRATPSLGAPVWTAKESVAGIGGTILSEDRTRPLDRLYNAVLVAAGTTDGSQAWTSVMVQIDDPTSPRYPGNYGVGLRVKELTSTTAATEADATALAQATLTAVQGTTETVNLGILSNPALECGDVIQIVTSAWQDTPGETLTHLIDGFSIDLVTGAMSLDTRSGVADG